MALQVLALGDAGARMARALLYALSCGVTPEGPMTVTLLCAGEEAAAEVRAVYEDYQSIRLHTSRWTTGCFSRQAALRAWPEGQTGLSLNDQASGETDQWLSRALFTREQASLSPGRAMDAGYDMAAMSWAAMLSGDADGALRELRQELEQDPDTPVVMLGSLCETVCAAGVGALCTYLARITPRSPGAALLLPVYTQERNELCLSTLRTADLEHRLRSLCLVGMPEDCRSENAGQVQLADWLAVYAACRQLTGLEGRYVWRIAADALHWEMFGEDADAWRQGYESLMQLTYMMIVVYGEQLMVSLESPNRLRDMMIPWYNAHFGAARKMEDEERLALLADVRVLMRYLQGYAQWFAQLQHNLPPVMRWADALRDVRAKAEEHYAAVLETAGQRAWLAQEIAESGMAEERYVHRHDMRDSEAEAAVKQLEQLTEKLTELTEQQDELNRSLGGRLSRSMLEAVIARCAKEADDLRAQAKEAARRIDRAEQIATTEELSRVATARSRLTRMERHVTLLDGRTRQARIDAERWNGAALRRLPPRLSEETGSAEVGVFGDTWLAELLECTQADGRDRKHLLKVLQDDWPWASRPLQPLRPLCERIARNEFPDPEDTCLGGFVRCVLRCCMEDSARQD